MVRTDTLRTFGDKRGDPSYETVINGAPYCPVKTIGRNAVHRLSYREEYMRDQAQDLDEWLDGAESRQAS
jgi:hypothetical protein